MAKIIKEMKDFLFSNWKKILPAIIIVGIFILQISIVLNRNSYIRTLEDKAVELEELKRTIELKNIEKNKITIDSLADIRVKLDGVIVMRNWQIKVLKEENQAIRVLQEQKWKENEILRKKLSKQVDSTGRPVITNIDRILFD